VDCLFWGEISKVLFFFFLAYIRIRYCCNLVVFEREVVVVVGSYRTRKNELWGFFPLDFFPSFPSFLPSLLQLSFFRSLLHLVYLPDQLSRIPAPTLRIPISVPFWISEILTRPEREERYRAEVHVGEVFLLLLLLLLAVIVVVLIILVGRRRG